MVIRRSTGSYLAPLLALCLILGIIFSAVPSRRSTASFTASSVKTRVVDLFSPFFVLSIVLVYTIVTVDWFLPSTTSSEIVVRKKIEAYRNRGGLHFLYHGWLQNSASPINFTREMYLNLPLQQPISLERTPILKKVKLVDIPQLSSPLSNSLEELIAEEKAVGSAHALSPQLRVIIVLIILGFIVINFVTLDLFSL